MKLSLVVASGVHEGKPIPITTPQFLIGRDPQCQLRPASPAISKRHCAVMVRGGKVFVRDFGSTNGTFVNDQLVQGEVEVQNGDRLKVGPLDFKVALEVTAPAPKPAAAKPQPAAAAAAAPTPATAAQPVAAAAPKAAEDEGVELKAPPSDGPTSDKLAELLLDDDSSVPAATTQTLDNSPIPDGSTVMELPAAVKEGASDPKKAKSVIGTGNTSQAAADILSKYYRRPRS